MKDEIRSVKVETGFFYPSSFVLHFFAVLGPLLAGCALAIVVGIAASSRTPGQEHERRASSPAILNLGGAFESIASEGTLLKFTLGETNITRGGHLQGIQIHFDAAKNRHVAFLSHDSQTVAYLVIVQFPSALDGDGRVIHIHEFPTDGRSPPLRHAGGIQLLGDVLVVGLEDNQQKTRSEIQFWDVSIPEQPAQLRHLTIRRAGAPKDKTAGATGLAQREKDHLLAVANWDSRDIDFYVSNGKLLADPTCRFKFSVRWSDDVAEKGDWHADAIFGAYQAVNLVSDVNRNIFLIGFHTTSADTDMVDLYSVDIGQQPNKLLRKLASKQMKLQGENHFRYSGGVWIHEDRLAILSSQRDLHRQTRINIASQAR